MRCSALHVHMHALKCICNAHECIEAQCTCMYDFYMQCTCNAIHMQCNVLSVYAYAHALQCNSGPCSIVHICKWIKASFSHFFVRKPTTPRRRLGNFNNCVSTIQRDVSVTHRRLRMSTKTLEEAHRQAIEFCRRRRRRPPLRRRRLRCVHRRRPRQLLRRLPISPKNIRLENVESGARGKKKKKNYYGNEREWALFWGGVVGRHFFFLFFWESGSGRVLYNVL